MTTNPIAPAPTMALAQDALEVLCWLSLQHPQLRAPYITVHSFRSTSLQFQVPFGAFEAWREALEIDAEDVRLYSTGDDSHIDVTSTLRLELGGKQVSVTVHLYGVGLPVLAERPADMVPAAPERAA